MIVTQEPDFGTLKQVGDSITYHLDENGSDDTFSFLGTHAYLGTPVFFSGEVSSGFLKVSYEYEFEYEYTDDEEEKKKKKKTVKGEVDLGTVFMTPGTTPQFPEGTVVIDTDNGVDDTDSIDEIACIRQCQKAKELHSYSGVTSLGQVWAILKLHKDGSIPALAISGHGGIGGVMFEAGENEDGYVPDTNFDGHTLGGGKYDEVVDMIKKKLKPGATIYVLGCNACSGGLNERGTQKLADVTGRKVVANESAVTFIEHPYSPTTIGDKFVGVGNWFIFEPKVKSAPLAPVHQ